jgi:hypothetical protein
MTQTTPAEERRFAITLLVFAAIFVGVAIFGGIVVTPWLYLVGLTAIPNVLAAVTSLRRTSPSAASEDRG